MNWYLFFVGMLGVLEIPLIRLMVSDASRGEPMLPWFIVFYLQSAVLAYLILRPFRKGKLRWYRLFSRICGISLIGILLFSAIHLLTGKAPDGLILPDLYDAEDWTQAAIIPLRWAFSFCGMILMLGRREPRKRALIFGLIYLVGGLLFLGILSGSSALRNTAAGNLMANGYIFGLPHLAGLIGALFMRIWGRKIEEEEQRQTASEQKAPARRSGAASTAKPAPPSGPSPEEKLQKLQEKYEKDKRKQNRIKKPAPKPELEPKPAPMPAEEKPAPKPELEPKPAPVPAEEKPASEKENPPQGINALKPIRGTEIDTGTLLRFIRRILTGSTSQRQAELALNQLAAILKAQNCPPELLDLIQKALAGQRADFAIMQEEALQGLKTAQTLASASSRAKEAEQRRLEAERYGRC